MAAPQPKTITFSSTVQNKRLLLKQVNYMGVAVSSLGGAGDVS